MESKNLGKAGYIYIWWRDKLCQTSTCFTAIWEWSPLMIPVTSHGTFFFNDGAGSFSSYRFIQICLRVRFLVPFYHEPVGNVDLAGFSGKHRFSSWLMKKKNRLFSKCFPETKPLSKDYARYGTGIQQNSPRGGLRSCGYPQFIRYGTIVESVNGFHLIISKVGWLMTCTLVVTKSSIQNLGQSSQAKRNALKSHSPADCPIKKTCPT